MIRKKGLNNQGSFLGNFLVHGVLMLLAACCIFPLIAIFSISLTDEKYIVWHGYSLFAKEPTLYAYKYLLNNPLTLLNAYKVTITNVLIGVPLGMFFMTLVAYPISRPDFAYRRPITLFIVITMLFNGGLVPTYLVVSRLLNLSDTQFAMIIPYLVSAWNIMLLRSFFQTIPIALIESAKIDGSSEFRTYFTIVLPLSKPAIATVSTFVLLTYWNDWWTPMLYINNQKLYNLQYLLQRMMAMIEELMNAVNYVSTPGATDFPQESLRMAMCLIAAGPMLFVFSLLQKYFVRGLTVGSVKG